VSPFPATIFIEPTTACNLRCRMCPCHGAEKSVSLPPRFMDMALYMRVLDEAAAHNSGLGEMSINPQLRGEPLLHPEFPAMLREARLRGLRTTLSTNGTLLRGKALDAVAEYADYVFVSLDAVRPETYRSIRGADCRAAFDGIEALLERRGRKTTPAVYAAFVKLEENAGEREEFLDRWLARADGVLVYQERLPRGWYGDPNVPPPSPRPPCPHLQGSCAVLVGGEVTPCCFAVSESDALGTLGGGATLEEVYGGEGFARLRALHDAGRFSESALCAECNAYESYGPPVSIPGGLVLTNAFTTFFLKTP